MRRSSLDTGRFGKRRVIDLLRSHVAGRWTYEYPSIWKHESGFQVQAFAQLVDEDEFCSVYRRSDTGEIVHPFTGDGLIE